MFAVAACHAALVLCFLFIFVNVKILNIVKVLIVVDVLNVFIVNKHYLVLALFKQFLRQCAEVFVAVNQRVFGCNVLQLVARC